MQQPENYPEICAKCINQAQKKYEAIRPILFYEYDLELRAFETGLHEKTLNEYLRLFKTGNFELLEIPFNFKNAG